MSRVYFHTPTDEAELLGAERAHAGVLTHDLAAQHITPVLDPLGELTAHGRLVGTPRAQLADRFNLYARTGGTPNLLIWHGRELRASSLMLNTALELGDDGVKLMARLYGQCEIHAYVEGPHRAWLADIMERGLATGVLRRGMGWEGKPDHPHGKGRGVIPLLRSRDDEPVVMSYSVCDGFPNPVAWDWEPPAEWRPPSWTAEEWAELDGDDQEDYRASAVDEAFGALPSDERWRIAMGALRARSKAGLLELTPDGWDDFCFGHELSLFDLQADDWRDRVERALDAQAQIEALWAARSDTADWLRER
ncbi:hypothetical protein DQ384_05155 [Sphaerisporangium album]|uniref:Uncharacterized protein n=1 Tax=Sphaerisporangium album TaxID=509200 RepID=A0A367FNF8_9ACTN|nr:hypothetical protein [Sphaerisporangium album]RCG31933.1 hypothetical protein DQ384_05155 [Sphaerisporangium album]